MKLKDSMELGGEHLLGWLNPERDYLPTGSWAITHDLARWWDAMLRLEDATGFVIPGNLEGASLRNLAWLTDNPDGLLWVPPGLDWHEMKFEFHSFREGILTFAALAHFRGSTWAKAAGHRYLESINRALKPDFSWDVHAFEYAKHCCGWRKRTPRAYSRKREPIPTHCLTWTLYRGINLVLSVDRRFTCHGTGEPFGEISPYLCHERDGHYS